MTIRRIAPVGIVFVLGALVVAGCSRDRDAVERAGEAREAEDLPETRTGQNQQRTDYPPAVRPAQIKPAVDAITASRCQRETRCENVGSGRKYSSETDCLQTVRADWRDDLNARECPEGVDQGQLDECLAKVRSEDCNAPFDTLARVTECTANQICRG